MVLSDMDSIACRHELTFNATKLTIELRYQASCRVTWNVIFDPKIRPRDQDLMLNICAYFEVSRTISY